MLNSGQKFIADMKLENEREGISLFEVKNRDLLSYMTEVTNLMCQMSFAESIQGCSALERCVFLRTVLERIRPIEQKLKPYVEKSISTSATNTVSKQVLRPRPDLMKVGDEEISEESEMSDDEMGGRSSSVQKYVPPKMMALRYDEDEKAKEERVLEHARRRALESSLISDLRAQYSEAPEELEEERRNRKVKQKDLEKQKYEEDYMIRLQMTKKQQHEHRLQNRQNVLDELLHFGDYMAMDEGSKNKNDKKRKGSSGKGPKGKRSRASGNRFDKMKGGRKMGKRRSQKH
ncbi:unnamed protein product [Anisakis simplex]|uniref:Neuroguidin (inferred by orthology to a human protein) n=1 Tax=Anisakis simplex TaxID=6269 RepID=A0A0M3JU52_ANISI|nr:unnamed protein product [Anisakis simplex]